MIYKNCNSISYSIHLRNPDLQVYPFLAIKWDPWKLEHDNKKIKKPLSHLRSRSQAVIELKNTIRSIKNLAQRSTETTIVTCFLKTLQQRHHHSSCKSDIHNKTQNQSKYETFLLHWQHCHFHSYYFSYTTFLFLFLKMQSQAKLGNIRTMKPYAQTK